ncbi:MAG: T9SS type A sorting domain-containing protein [Saprospiraceae bacterium]|nr:T9SS type A sorting domain-containing protein [Saprospiraceae bacterium]
MADDCSQVPLICGLATLNNNSNCALVPYANYTGDNCNNVCYSPQNQVHYAFTTNGTALTITLTYTNCDGGYQGNNGIQMILTSECCSGNLNLCTTGTYPGPGVYSIHLNLSYPTACKIYYLHIDGLQGTYCDYFLTVDGGAPNAPLELNRINNISGNSIDLKRGACSQKFTVQPKLEPCEGYYEWTLDGVILNDHDREVFLDFPNEGDFELCVHGYVGLPNLNCGESNTTCTMIQVRQEHRSGPTRVLCNEEKGYKWHKLSINASGFYTQEFKEFCLVYDSTLEFIILDKPQSAFINYVSCSKSDPYYDPVQKQNYFTCTVNKKIVIPKSTEFYACDSSYLLNVVFVDLQNKMHLRCRNGQVFMVPEITNFTDTCKVAIETSLAYIWYEKVNSELRFLSNDRELVINKRGNYQLQVVVNYKLGGELGICNFQFEENIDEDAYLMNPLMGSLLGKNEVCKGELICYQIDDIVQNPYSFNWTVDQGVIESPNPNQSDSICVRWDKNSLQSSGKVCVNYSDSCATSLQACLEVLFGKSQQDVAGPNQEVKGVLGTKLKGSGKKGLWTYAGGPSPVIFTDPTDPFTKVRVSRFGSYQFKWTTMDADCEIYGFVTVNFYIEFPQLEGEYLPPYKGFGEAGKSVPAIQTNYINQQLTFQGILEGVVKLDYQIINLQGQVLFNGELPVHETNLSESINLSLSPGFYYVIMTNGAASILSKFIVL